MLPTLRIPKILNTGSLKVFIVAGAGHKENQL